MTTPMIDRLKERIAELEQTNAVLQTLLACAIDALPGDDGPADFSAERVVEFSGRTITSEPYTHPETGETLGVHVFIDPVDLPDFGSDMGNLLSKEAH